MTDRREFLHGAMASAAGFSITGLPFAKSLRSGAIAANDLAAIKSEIEKRHDESVKRLQNWIKLPSIAAENRNMSEGCQLMMDMLKEAGFQTVKKIPTDGHPGVSGGGVLDQRGDMVGIPIGRMQGDYRFSFILPMRAEMLRKVPAFERAIDPGKIGRAS